MASNHKSGTEGEPSPTQTRGKDDAKFWSNLPEIADVLDSDRFAAAAGDGEWFCRSESRLVDS